MTQQTDHERLERLERHVKSQDRKNYGYYLCALVLVVLISLSFVNTSNDNSGQIGRLKGITAGLNELTQRLSHDEYSTCVVQSRGLPAGHDLSAGLGATVTFLRMIPVKSISSYKVRHLIITIESDLGKYSTIEGRQPASRTCSRVGIETTTKQKKTG